MKINEFRKLNNVLCRVTHTIKLCMGKIEVDEASVGYDGNKFKIDFTCELTGVDLGYLSSSIDGESADLVITTFVRYLISQLNGKLRETKSIHYGESMNLEAVGENLISVEQSSLEMLIDVLNGFLPE